VSHHRPVYVGIDLGTSAIKAVALGEDRRVRASARYGYATARPQPGAAEQDPRDWFAGLASVLAEVAAAVPARSWAGVGLSAMLPTLVELDADGEPYGPAITWEDSRAEAEASVLRAEVGDDELYRITGQRVDGRYLTPMHARLRGLGQAGVSVAGAKDVLFGELTGQLLTDPSTAAGFGVFDLQRGRWNPDLVAAADLSGLPSVAPASTTLPIRGCWSDRLGLPAGLPVVLGAADSVLGALGVGAVDGGDVAVIAGTSAIVLGVSDALVLDRERRYLVTPLAGDGWGLEMDLLAVGSAFEWMAGLLGLSGPAALLDAAAEVPLEEAPVFLPYLAPGEQGALWDPELTGALHGVRLGMGAGHIGRGLLTGVVTELRRCVEVLATTTGRRGPILLGGGGAVSPLLWQDLADATGREVRVDPLVRDHSALGAALFAASSLGCPIAPGSAAMRAIAPRPSRFEEWSEIAERHDALRRAQGVTG
jgi:xylulokinase